MLTRIFPGGTHELDDDVAVILVNLGRAEDSENGEREPIASIA
jgi:hypothetical protein